MAVLDDPEWLLRHIRHSFITSDDTGMCEMVIQDSDCMMLDEHRKVIKQQQKAKLTDQSTFQGLPESFGKSTPTNSNASDNSSTLSSSPVTSPVFENSSPLAPSPDILSGWDFGMRRRSNTAQKLERIRKERQSRIKIKSVHWRKRNTLISQDQMSSLFEKKYLGHERDAVKENSNAIIEKKISFGTTSAEVSSELNREIQSVRYGFEIDECEDKLSDVNDTDGPKTIHKNKLMNGDHSISISDKKEAGRNCAYQKKVTVSVLSKLLSESKDPTNSPFREYSKFDGTGHGSSNSVKRINIFVWPYGVEKPKFSMPVSVLVNGAKVMDTIGLTCWQYFSENREPILRRKNVQGYSLHIAEDDGSVDHDFPALEPSEPISKFGFTTLALLEKQTSGMGGNGDDANGVKESVFVKVNDHAGFSLIQVEDLSITMGEILKKTIKRRKGQNHPGRYRLEYQNKVGVAVNEDQTLESTGVMEFHIVREHSTRNDVMNNAFENNSKKLSERMYSQRDNEYRFPPLPKTDGGDKSFVFVPAMETQIFRLSQLHKVRSPTEITFEVGPNQIDIDPIHRRESKSAISQLLSPRIKSLSIRVTMLAHCAIHESKNNATASSLSISPSTSSGGNSFSSTGFSNSVSSFMHQDGQSSLKSSEKSVFKLYYKLSDIHTEFKHLTFEGPTDVVDEAVAKVKQIMMIGGNTNLQSDFKAVKLGNSSTNSGTNNNLNHCRKGSFFR